MELSQRFAQFICKIDYNSLGSEVLKQAKERLIDTIGALLAGYAGWPYRDALIAACRELGDGDMRAAGTGQERFPVARAAMLNATFAHAVELDDGHRNAGVHAGAVVVPAALAVGAALGKSGKETLAAIVAGYEIAYRLAVVQSPSLIQKGFHPSATCGSFGAMAAAGKLMNLSQEQLANGLGFVGNLASGLMEATVSGQQSKCILVGHAALNGITAAYYARSNMEGTQTIFEGKNGIFSTMSEGATPDKACDGLGERYLIGDTYNKFYPTCRHSQPAIEAVLDLMAEHDFGGNEVNKVKVGTHKLAHELTGLIVAPKDSGGAKFSAPYCVAVALKEGGVAVRHLSEAFYTNRELLELSERVEVSIDEKINSLYPEKRGAGVEIHLRDGRVLYRECFDLKGSPANPVGVEELIQKFRVNAKGLLSDAAAEELLSRMENFEDERDIGGFIGLLNW